MKLESFHGDAIVCIKTKNAMRSGTKLEKVEPMDNLWYWGSGKKLKEKVFDYEV